MSLQVKVITPEKVIWSDTSDQVVLPAVTGDLGILKDHAPLVTVLDAGVVRKRSADKWVPLIVFGGFAEVENNQVTILGNGAEEISSTLTKQDAQKMLDKGLRVMVNSDDPAYFGGYLNKNLIDTSKALNLELNHVKILIENSFKSSFLNEKIKNEWLKKIN